LEPKEEHRYPLEPRVKIFLLNGPPRVGKDTTANMLSAMLENARIMRFAEPVKMSAHAIMRMLKGSGTVPLCEAFDGCKDEPNPYFRGLAPREVYIAVSEDLCKPLFGKDIFGKLLAERIQEMKDQGVENFIIPDSGFQEEAMVLKEHFGDQVYVLNLRRNGTCFNGDSRGRIYLKDNLTYDIGNNGTRGDLRVRVSEVLRDIENGWVRSDD